MCCAPASGREVVVYFRVEESCQRKGPKEVNLGIWSGQEED